MQCIARTSVTVVAGGAGAIGVARLPSNQIVCDFGKHPRRRRSRKAVASVNIIASTKSVAFATLTARGIVASLGGVAGVWAPPPNISVKRTPARGF